MERLLNLSGKDKVVGKVKTEKNKRVRKEIGRQLLKELRSLKRLSIPMTKFQELLVSSKMINIF